MMFSNRKHKHRKQGHQPQDAAANMSEGPVAGPVSGSATSHSDASSGLRDRFRNFRDKMTRKPSPNASSIASANSSSEIRNEGTSNVQELPSTLLPDAQTIDPETPSAGTALVQVSSQTPVAGPLASESAPSLESQPQSLWDRAYDALKESNSSLVEDYELLLVMYEKLTGEELKDASESTSEPLVAAAHDHSHSTRRQLLDRVIAMGLKRMEENHTKYTIAGRDFRPSDQIAKAAELVLWAKTWVSEAVKSSPEASIAWAGVSIFLPLLTQAKTAEDDNRDGYTDVTFRMRYYTELEHMLRRLGSNPGVSSGLMAEANSQIVNLYQHIIEYQILSAVRYYKTSLRRYTGDVILAVDWKKMRTKIEQLDKSVSDILNQIDLLATRETLESLKKTSKEVVLFARELLRVQEDLLQGQREAMRKQQAEKEEKCLQLFRLTSGDRDATYEWYKGRVEDRVHDTCNWFLEHGNFKDWLNSESGPLLVSADPGCGKSVLAKFLIDHELANLPETTICYFFFKDQDQCTARQALCALLHQLLSAKPFLIKYAMEPYAKEGTGLVNSTSSLWGILKQAVQDELSGPVIIVLDALDECAEPDFEDLMRNIRHQFWDDQQGCNQLRCLFTSRPYEQIVSRFRGLLAMFPHIRIPGEDQSEEISREVNHVIKYRVDQLSEEENLAPHLKAHLEKQLLKIEHRTYLWVYLVFDYLKAGFKRTEKGIQAAIDTLPRTVSEAYEQILDKSRDDPMVRKALGIILAANQPLTLSEMNVAFNIDYNEDLDLEDDKDFKSRLRSWCGLFVSIYHRKVYFLHQTAREFLVGSLTSATASPSSSPRWHCSFTMQDAHRILAEACVLYLRLTPDSRPRNKTVGFDDFSTDSDDFSTDSDDFSTDSDDSSTDFVFMEYSATEWDHHFREANFADGAAIMPLAVALCGRSESTWVSERELEFEEWYLKGARRRGEPELTSGISLWGLELASALGLENVARQLLLQGTSVNGVGHRIWTPLCLASLSDSVATIRVLLEGGADVNEVSPGGDTPLLVASSNDKNAAVGFLIEHGSDYEAKDDKGKTSLALACENRNEAIVQLLLDKGADIETRDDNGKTPLALACKNGNEAIVQLLLDRGADIETKDDEGRTPLALACETGNDATAQLLLDRGANIESKDKNGETPLIAAAFWGQDTAIKLLLEAGADIESKDEDGWTPLIVAASQGQDTAIKLLLEAGADIESKYENGWTPLIAAAFRGQDTAIKLLLKAGADIESKDNKGWTPVTHACYWAFSPGGLSVLLENGADVNAVKILGSEAIQRLAKNDKHRDVLLEYHFDGFL